MCQYEALLKAILQHDHNHEIDHHFEPETLNMQL